MEYWNDKKTIVTGYELWVVEKNWVKGFKDARVQVKIEWCGATVPKDRTKPRQGFHFFFNSSLNNSNRGNSSLSLWRPAAFLLSQSSTYNTLRSEAVPFPTTSGILPSSRISYMAFHL